MIVIFFELFKPKITIQHDFNFHLELFADKEAANFKNTLHMHEFKSCAAEPTHEQCGWLNVVVTKAGCNGVAFLDHNLLQW